MRINFFSEFPEKGIEKASKIDFDSKVFLASNSLEEFRGHREDLQDVNGDLEPGYWPLIADSYWISPFSPTDELRRVAEELQVLQCDNVLIDLEPPLLNKKLMITRLPFVIRNKKTIRELFRTASDQSLNVHTAEFVPSVPGLEYIKPLLGLRVNSEEHPHTPILMYYSSMMGSIRERHSRRYIQSNEGFELGLGTIETGILGDEPILSPEGLERDLKFAEEQGIKTVNVFRLGGLDEEYLKIMKKFVD